MAFADMVRDEAARLRLASCPAAPLLHGHLRVEGEPSGWVRPWRMAEPQVRALSSVGAWHPGLYRQMAAATAGICVEFLTDAREVALEVRLDAEPRGTARVLEGLSVDAPDDPDVARPAFDGVSCDFDDVHLGPVMPLSQAAPADARGDQPSFVCFALGDDHHANDAPADTLPGLSAPHHVRIWLPCLRGCVVRDVIADGSLIEPVPVRGTLMVLGDSLAQGFVAGDPALCWPTLLAAHLGLDVVNQGIGGQVFQPGALAGLSRLDRPENVIVEYGLNYRFEQCQAGMVARDVRAYLFEVARLWPGVPTWVITPTGHREHDVPTHPRSCFGQVPQMIADAAARHGQMRVLGGPGLLPARKALLADDDHPNQAGHAYLAERLATTIERRGGALVRSLNPSERTFARDEETGRFVVSPARGEGLDFGEEPKAERESQVKPDPEPKPEPQGKPDPEPKPEPEPEPQVGRDPGPMAERLVTAPTVIVPATGIPDDGVKASKRREVAKGLLERGPDCAFPLQECLRRSLGEVLHCSAGAVLMRIPADDSYLLHAPDPELGERVVAGLESPKVLTLLGSGLEGAARSCGLDSCHRFHLLLPVSGLLPPDEAPTLAGQLLPWDVDAERAASILALDESFLGQLMDAYEDPLGVSSQDLASCLGRGGVLGALTDDFELVGFVGEQPEGSVGMLEVLPGHRRQGWGRALLAAKLNEHLARGLVPWSQVMEGNDASLALHESLGLRATPASEQCVCWRGTR